MNAAVYHNANTYTESRLLPAGAYEKMLGLIADNIEANGEDRILNIGCGCGGLARELEKKGFDVTVVSKGWQKSFASYDVIIATHLHSFSDIKNMCRLAKKRVYIVSSADFGVRLFSGHHNAGADVYDNLSQVFNMLYTYGINPNVKIIKPENTSDISLIYWDS